LFCIEKNEIEFWFFFINCDKYNYYKAFLKVLSNTLYRTLKKLH